jgi:rod shape determining protein RodA
MRLASKARETSRGVNWANSLRPRGGSRDPPEKIRMLKPRAISHSIDWFLIVSVVLISIGGILNLYSAVSFSMGRDLYLTQIYWYAFGTVMAVVVATIDYRTFEKYAYVLYGVGILLLFAVLLFGREINGSRRWLEIGGFNLQPSELMKVFILLAIGKYIASQPSRETSTFADVGVLGFLTFMPMLLVMKQPDLGTALILFIIFLTVLFLYRLKLTSILMSLILVSFAVPISWTYLLQGYQRQRILTFLNPEADVLGSGWHAYQSQIAIGSGHIFGKGLMNSTQNSHGFLPAHATDFPFSVWCEEQGLVGSLLILFFYLMFIVLALRVASNARDRFALIVSFGIANIFFWQSFLNIGMVSGVLPIVGVTLPFFSYGGSSVFMALLCVGILLNFSMRREAQQTL